MKTVPKWLPVWCRTYAPPPHTWNFAHLIKRTKVQSKSQVGDGWATMMVKFSRASVLWKSLDQFTGKNPNKLLLEITKTKKKKKKIQTAFLKILQHTLMPSCPKSLCYLLIQALSDLFNLLPPHSFHYTYILLQLPICWQGYLTQTFNAPFLSASFSYAYTTSNIPYFSPTASCHNLHLSLSLSFQTLEQFFTHRVYYTRYLHMHPTANFPPSL